jgi:microcystin-dependent protein
MAAGAIGNSGGSQPHDNMAPTLALNYIIAMFGIFPSRN